MVALFMYIGIAISLIVTVIFGLITAFQVINYLVPSDSLNWYADYRYGILSGLPSFISFLTVAFGILCFLSWKVRTIFTDYRETVWYPLCHAVIMLILTVSMGAIAVSLALIISGMLAGDISLSYLFKLLFTIGAGAVVFFYYRGVMRGLWRTHKREERAFVISVTLLVFILIAASVGILNPPQRQALNRTYDTLETMRSVSDDIYTYYRDTELLPVDIEDSMFLRHKTVNREHFFPLREHETGTFTYEPGTGTSYRLCASFDALPQMTFLDDYPYRQFPVEETGMTCFTLDATESPYSAHR